LKIKITEGFSKNVTLLNQEDWSVTIMKMSFNKSWKFLLISYIVSFDHSF